MASEHPNARPVFPSGVRHAHVRHTSHYTVIGNHLTQHRELSLTAIGLAAHIQSLPGGSQVGIKALAKRFTEGEIRIASALRELERHGYLSRTQEKLPGGKLITRTVSYNRPGGLPEPDPAPPPPPPPPPSPPSPSPSPPSPSPPPSSPPSPPSPSPSPQPSSPQPSSPPPPLPRVRTEEPPPAPDPEAEPELWYDLDAEPETEPDPETEPEFGYDPDAEPDAEPDPEAPAPVREPAPPTVMSSLPAPEEVIPSRRAAAKALLGRLRRIDRRLLLGERDIDRLAGGVEAWLERGASPDAVVTALTASLPEPPRNPAGLVAYRLTRQLPPALGPVYRELAYVAPDPFQTCETCELAFRSRTRGKCRGCAAESAA
ncbi:helix-turn-helix domain-containing protein [Streptomyces sp. ISL-43]|uniref:helix-turn-helix domain-containing protein n=1 Tax=Streptomyces sp. ISL-43 TaxID=2819183 RepID=UPI001BE78CBC|nr:helix-turn-helix domain-containing protein [Streptomyces sp. ISL-43]MBT2445624.1 helix-turn-helix domain-containing protein [Streptomyces sp. ISL-43]